MPRKTSNWPNKRRQDVKGIDSLSLAKEPIFIKNMSCRENVLKVKVKTMLSFSRVSYRI